MREVDAFPSATVYKVTVATVYPSSLSLKYSVPSNSEKVTSESKYPFTPHGFSDVGFQSFP